MGSTALWQCQCMAREKATVTIDRDKLERAQALISQNDVRNDRRRARSADRRAAAARNPAAYARHLRRRPSTPTYRSSLISMTTMSTTRPCMAKGDDPGAHRGEVWFADVPGKRRPVLVLSRDPMGRLLHSVICAPVTSRRRGLATEVVLGPEVGRAHGSISRNFDNTFLLARSRLLRRLGRASRATMDDACRALGTASGRG